MVSLVSSERAYPGRVAAINSAMLAMAALSRHFRDGAYRIRARDEEQRHVSRIMFTKLAQRIGRVGDARAVYLDAADVEGRVAAAPPGGTSRSAAQRA